MRDTRPNNYSGIALVRLGRFFVPNISCRSQSTDTLSFPDPYFHTKILAPIMNFNANDNPLLVAPRPVRITSAPHTHTMLSRAHPVRLVTAPADHFERVKITDDSDMDDLTVGVYDSSSASDKDLASPRASPR